MLYRITSPWYWFDFTWKCASKGRRCKELITRLHKITRGIIAEREMKMNEEREKKSSNDQYEKKPRPFLELMLNMKAEGRLSDEDIREEVDTIMLEVVKLQL